MTDDGVTEAGALLTVIRVLGPVKIIYRGDAATWETAFALRQRQRTMQWLRETATWIKTPSWREQQRMKAKAEAEAQERARPTTGGVDPWAAG